MFSTVTALVTRATIKKHGKDTGTEYIFRAKTPDLPARQHGIHLSRVPRHAASATDDHAHRYPDGGDLCLREHDQQAAQGLPPQYLAAVYDLAGPVFRDEQAKGMKDVREVQHQDPAVRDDRVRRIQSDPDRDTSRSDSAAALHSTGSRSIPDSDPLLRGV